MQIGAMVGAMRINRKTDSEAGVGAGFMHAGFQAFDVHGIFMCASADSGSGNL